MFYLSTLLIIFCSFISHLLSCELPQYHPSCSDFKIKYHVEGNSPPERSFPVINCFPVMLWGATFPLIVPMLCYDKSVRNWETKIHSGNCCFPSVFLQTDIDASFFFYSIDMGVWATSNWNVNNHDFSLIYLLIFIFLSDLHLLFRLTAWFNQ